MSIRYLSLGEDKLLNQIVMAGSHDAGVTSGKFFTKTQSLNIKGQAKAGVRIFDLRVAPTVDHNMANLRAYHGISGPKYKTNAPKVWDDTNTSKTKIKTLVAGSFAQGLISMLKDAKAFVEKTSEFLLLKFDKCMNWDAIAKTCQEELDDTLYTQDNNLNIMRIGDLKKKVIVLFMDDVEKGAFQQLDDQYKTPGSGILGIKNLIGAPGGYDSKYAGLQYIGKGGTSLNPFKNKRNDNRKKQAQRLAKGQEADANVMGMMYWTTTGLIGHIRLRNWLTWRKSEVNRLKALWRDCLGDDVRNRVPSSVDMGSSSSGGVINRFLPNFIMIDFANPNRCETIYELNTTPSIQFSKLAKEYEEELESEEDL